MTPMVAANWKMYKGEAEAVAWTEAVCQRLPQGIEAVAFPPATALTAVRQTVAGRPLQLGGQNLFYESAGAYTGEISPQMLVAAGCRYVLVGHSERRQIFGETDREVGMRLRAALDAGLVPLLCVGEQIEDYERADYHGAIQRQMGVALKGLEAEQVARIVMAYEPVWAIGTGRSATVVEAERAAEIIRQVVHRLYGTGIELPIVYGGSVVQENISGFVTTAHLDGVLVGSGSLDAEVFCTLMAEVAGALAP